MRCLLATAIAMLAVVPAAAAEFAPGSETRIDFGTPVFKSTRGPLALPVFVPTNYTPSKAFPLVLFFHGRGGKPDTRMMQGATDRKDYVIVGMEYLQEDQAFFADAETQLAFNRHVIRTVSKRVHVNPRQIFIGGFSQGGFATAMFGFRPSEVSTYRGYMMMAGGLGAARSLDCMSRQAVLVLHGDKDEVVPYDNGLQAADALRKAGASVTFLTQKGVGHTLGKQYAPEVGAWLRKQSEDPRLVALMRRAKAADPKNMPLAIRTYKQIVDSKSADPLATEAEERLTEIGKQGAEALVAAVEAAELLAKAKALLEAKDYVAADKAFESLAAHYTGTPAATEARAQADALRNDPDLGPKLRDAAAAADCRRWMTMAKNYLNSPRRAAAAPYLRKIIETYPNTTYAADAEAMLRSAR